jgi:hypothetical protein
MPHRLEARLGEGLAGWRDRLMGRQFPAAYWDARRQVTTRPMKEPTPRRHHAAAMGLLRRVANETDDEDIPSAPEPMTPDEAAAAVACLRHPRVLLRMFEPLVGELVHDLLLAQINRHPATHEIYVEHTVVSFIVELRPLMARTMEEFFGMSAAERQRRRASLREEGDYYARQDAEDSPACGMTDSEIAEEHARWSNEPQAVAGRKLDAALWAMDVAEWQRLALDVVKKPEAMSRDVRAMNAFAMVLALMDPNHTPKGKGWTAAEHTVLHMGQDACVPCLMSMPPAFRDLRRVFR